MSPTATTVWQVKASSLCNLRCRYCYEWDRLSDARRLPLATWEKVLAATRDYRDIRLARNGITSDSLLIWHGGEPLALPPDYVRAVLALQRRSGAFGLGSAAPTLINSVQTNLFRPNETLEVMVEAGFDFSVSYDGVEGVRVDGAGRDSSTTVRQNLAALIARGVPVGVAVVLGRHNAGRLAEIHDDVADLGAGWLRINPMFEPPAGAPADGLALGIAEILAALNALIEHRAATGATLEVAPLGRAARTVARWQTGEAADDYDRNSFGESRFVVHPDGVLATLPGPQTPDRVLGDLTSQTMQEIVAGPAFQASLARDQSQRTAHCGPCAFHRACTGMPIFETPLDRVSGPCPVEARLCARIAGMTGPELIDAASSEKIASV